MERKYLPLNDGLYDYLIERHSGARDSLLEELAEVTRAKTDHSAMQISPEQGTLLTMLTALTGGREALEIGTFTGYSALCIARGLAPGGRLTCVDMSEAWTSIGRPFWERAGVADRIQLHIGPALKVLPEVLDGRELDLVFIDADKTGYRAYYDLVLPHVRQGGLILFDNMLMGGEVAQVPDDPEGVSQNALAIDKMNWKLALDPRVQSVLLSIADGLQIVRKL